MQQIEVVTALMTSLSYDEHDKDVYFSVNEFLKQISDFTDRQIDRSRLVSVMESILGQSRESSAQASLVILDVEELGEPGGMWYNVFNIISKLMNSKEFISVFVS